MRLAGYVIAALIGGLGLLFVVGAQGQASRLVVGAVLLLGGGALVVALRLRPSVVEHKIVQRVDIAGPAKLQRLECPQCGASLEPSALRSEQGVATITCPFCQTTHQLQEDVKW